MREKLKETGKYDDLFQALSETLENVGLEYSKCGIVDATFVDAPRNRNLDKEQREALKAHEKNPESELPFEIDKELIYEL